MKHSKLQQLAERYGLGVEVSNKLARLVELVVEDETAPTTIREPGEVVDRHIADSLSIFELEGAEVAGAGADVGSGAGFPGLVLAIARPQAEVFLVESVAKKCGFMERAVERLGIPNASVVCLRVEEWRDGVGSCGLVTARALAPLAVLAEYAAPLLRIGGTLVAWKGARDTAEELAAEAACKILGLELRSCAAVTPYKRSRNHHLYVVKKLSETPAGFPRRSGTARKRPLSTGNS